MRHGGALLMSMRFCASCRQQQLSQKNLSSHDSISMALRAHAHMWRQRPSSWLAAEGLGPNCAAIALRLAIPQGFQLLGPLPHLRATRT
jgi:hypothetical protein